MTAPDILPSLPTVSVVILAWQDEPWLTRSVQSVLDSNGVVGDVILVDNGCTTDDVNVLGRLDRVTLVRPDENLGFAGGCNYGLAHAEGEYFALLNSDAVVAPDALAKLVDALQQDGVQLAGASIRLDSDPELLNSAGNPVHILGLSWAGEMGKPEPRTDPVEVTVASGACLVTRARWWQELDGFDAIYFAYHEDADLSLRTWRKGGRVLYVPTAIAVHRYSFSRNSLKMYLLERNRLLLIGTLWGTRSLVLLLPPLLALELALLLMSILQGWSKEKVRGWKWLWLHRREIRARRRQMSAELTVPATSWMARLVPELAENGSIALPVGAGVLNLLLRSYWALVRRWV